MTVYVLKKYYRGRLWMLYKMSLFIEGIESRLVLINLDYV